MRSLALLLLLLLPLLLLGQLHVHATLADSLMPDSCCALCIGQDGGDYDPADCSSSSSSGRSCCSSCASATAQAPRLTTGRALEVGAGQWIQLSWPHVHRVTYEAFAENGTRTTITNSSEEALRTNESSSSGVSLFRICAAEQGMVLVRGWGEDACSTTTPQYQIQITSASNSSSDSNVTSCVTEVQMLASDYSVWGDQDEVGSEDTIPCNYNHATLVTDANGNQTCVCSTEWTGAPDCNGYVWWKIVLAALGTLAVLFAVFVLFCACTKARRQERRARRSAAAAAAAAPPMTALRRTSFEATMVDDVSFFSAVGVSPFGGYDGSGRRESLYRYHPHAHFSPAFRNKSDAKARSLIYN